MIYFRVYSCVYCKCMNGLPACMYVHNMRVVEGIGSLGLELQMTLYWAPHLGLLQEQ